MYHTKERRRHIRRRKIRRMAWRCSICAVGVLVLICAWKVTTLAIHHLLPEETEEQQIPESPSTEEAEEELAESMSGAVPSAVEDILLVNKTHPLDETYRPVLKKMHDYGVEVDASIYDALNEMLSDGEKEGLQFWVASAYRSLDRQRELLDEDIEALVRRGYSYSEAYEEVVKETMPVGCSEHATGLAVDIVAKDYQILDSRQADTDEIKWLQKNCSQYGFILRYPEGKEDITGVSYESWHFRYVGVDAAEEIMSRDLTLEEYLGAD